MTFTFDPLFAADPNNPAMVAQSASILIYDPADTGKAPLAITDSSGSPLANPITVNKAGFGPAFQHPTIDRVAWQGGGFEGFFTSYEGLKNEAVAARDAAEAAAVTAGAEASAAATASLSAAVASADTAATSATTAASAASTSAAAATAAANLVGAPADAAIAAAINGTGATKTALNATILDQIVDASSVTDTIGALISASSMTAVNQAVRASATLEDGRDLIAILGQSNAQGAGTPYDANIDVVLEGLLQPGVGGTKPAIDSLDHVGTWLTPEGLPRVGPGMEFGRKYWTQQGRNRDVLFIPSAQGSTGFVVYDNQTWDPLDTTTTVNLYTRAVNNIAANLATNPMNRLSAIIWVQGENDAAVMTAANYRTKLLTLIDMLRYKFGPVPFLIGSMVPGWIATTTQLQAIDAAHQEIATLRPQVKYVAGPAGMSQDGGIHYDSKGARELGRRLYTGYKSLPVKGPAGTLASSGALIKLRPSTWAAGVPAHATYVANGAQATANTLTGTTADQPIVRHTGTIDLKERTAKGGLHVRTATAGGELVIQWPAQIIQYIQANHTHNFFLNLWMRTTSAPTVAATSVLPVKLLTPTIWGIAVRGTDVQPDPLDRSFRVSDLMTVGMSRITALIDPGNINATLAADPFLWGISAGYGGQVLYGMDIIDQTVDGRSYAALVAAADAEWETAFKVGGVYNGDTWS